MTYLCGRRFTVSQKACQGRKKRKTQKKKGRERGAGSIFELLRVAEPSGSMLEIEPGHIVMPLLCYVAAVEIRITADHCVLDEFFS